MSAPGNAISYVYGEAAVDVSRITGIPWAYQQVETGGNSLPAINLLELDWYDQMRVAFTIIAVEHMLAAYFSRAQQEQNGDHHVDRDLAAAVAS